jgi:hypothetical protein
LCFEHVDNLGAYSIPSETGLLIPSGLNNDANRAYNGQLYESEPGDDSAPC